MRVCITGADGFVGTHLRRMLTQRGYDVHGIGLARTAPGPGTYRCMDINDTATLTHYLSSLQPVHLYHLAGVASSAQAGQDRQSTFRTNTQGVLSLLDATMQSGIHTRVLLAGTAHVYSAEALSHGAHETDPCAPLDFYGLTKRCAEMVMQYYARSRATDIIICRCFNHTGPGQSPRFVCADWAQQAAAIRAGTHPPVIRVGDLAPRIDFTDVRDVIEAYALLMEKAPSGQTYNVCSGTVYPLSWILEYLLRKTGREVAVHHRDDKTRPAGHAVVRSGDNTKLCAHTGWHPRIRMETTLDDLFVYWCQH